MTNVRRRNKYGSNTPGVLRQLINPSRTGHDASFDKILPSARDRLLREGLFEPDGYGSYKITKLGLERLKEIEGK